MKSKNLLFQLSKIEQSLHDFSFEELSTEEAAILKKSFTTFKNKVEQKIFQPTTILANTSDLASEYPQEAETSKNSENEVNLHIAKVSHEIRTPLNGIIGFTDLLKDDKQLNEKQQSQVSAIQKASYSLLEIISELLEYSKLASGMERFESIDFNLRNVVGDVMYLCETLISDKKIELTTSITSNVPEVLHGDPSKLTQVLLNLLGNAIKFVADGEISLKIVAKKSKNNITTLEFIVKDTGIGIAEEHLAHIFDSFKQAEHNTYKKYGGSGLGLNIVKKIIENLNGTIAVSSVLGSGTTFTFSIPYKVGELTAVKPKQNKVISAKETDRISEMQILVFEDNVLNQRLIEEQLKSWKCNVFLTDDATAGMEILQKEAIDLVLMDLKMPVLNGFEVSQVIRSSDNARIKQIPIIAVSADFSLQDEEQCKLHQINDFILKPYRTEELLSKLIKCKTNMERTLEIGSNFANPSASNYITDQKVDLANVLKECLGKLNLLEELVMLYRQNALEFMGSFRLHQANNDIEQMAFAAHKIKSGLKMMQSYSLLTIVEQIQKCLKTNADKKHLEFLFNCFIEEYPHVEKSIDAKMIDLKSK